VWWRRQLRDGASENADFVYRYCGNSTPPAFRSHGNTLWLKFRSDSSLRGSGFRATWETGAFYHCRDFRLSRHLGNRCVPPPQGFQAFAPPGKQVRSTAAGISGFRATWETAALHRRRDFRLPRHMGNRCVFLL